MIQDQNIELKKLLEKKKKRKAVKGGRPKLYGIFTNWLHQGFTYLDVTECIARVFFEVFPTVVLVFILKLLMAISFLNVWLWIVSVIIVHTLNWMFNFTFWANIIFAFPWLRNPGEVATKEYLNIMACRLKHCNAISGILLYGSVARGQWHDRSDLDIRFLRRPGFINGLKAAVLHTRERVIAFLCRQPLDSYIADGENFLLKMRKDEVPLFLKNEDERLDKLYPGCKVVEIDKLSKCNEKETS
jgi:predicted nucleotidyltransferase